MPANVIYEVEFQLDPEIVADYDAWLPGHVCDVRVLSMREVAGDVTHSLLHLDCRIWHTLRLLILRPAELARQFLAGRHQSHLPPFCRYLSVNILFSALT